MPSIAIRVERSRVINIYLYTYPMAASWTCNRTDANVEFDIGVAFAYIIYIQKLWLISKAPLSSKLYSAFVLVRIAHINSDYGYYKTHKLNLYNVKVDAIDFLFCNTHIFMYIHR